MSMTDPIADMLTRIRNGLQAGKREISVPSSNVKIGVVEVLKREGYIKDFDIVEAEPQNNLVLSLKYGSEGEMVIQHIQRASRPGCRAYVKAKEIPPVLNGLGIGVLSTNKGILSDREARAQNVGGELLCTVW